MNRALREQLEADLDGVALPGWFFDEAIAPALPDEAVLEVRRILPAEHELVWASLVDPATIAGWVSASNLRVLGGPPIRPGTRIAARGRIADRRASSDSTVVTRVDDGRSLAWTTRSRPKGLAGAIEFRWDVRIEPHPHGTEIVHRLRGVAFPPGALARLVRRAYDHVEAGMPTAMHRGIERFAGIAEARAR